MRYTESLLVIYTLLTSSKFGKFLARNFLGVYLRIDLIRFFRVYLGLNLLWLELSRNDFLLSILAGLLLLHRERLLDEVSFWLDVHARGNEVVFRTKLLEFDALALCTVHKRSLRCNNLIIRMLFNRGNIEVIKINLRITYALKTLLELIKIRPAKFIWLSYLRFNWLI